MADSGRFSIIPARAFDDNRLGAAPLRLLGLLGTYQNKRSGWCWPRQETLAKRSGQTTRAIRKSLETLKSLGYIEVRPIGTNRASGNRYKILHDVDLPEEFDRMAEVSPEHPIGTFETIDAPPEPHVPMTPEPHVPMLREQPKELPKKERLAADAAEYEFIGQVIRLKRDQFFRWKRAYSLIPDFKAELQSLDDYYTVHLAAGENWFCRASTALKKANTRAMNSPTNARNAAKAKAASQPQFADRLRELDAQFEQPERQP